MIVYQIFIGLFLVDNKATTVAEGQDGSSDDEPVEEVEVATVTVEGEVVEVYVNEEGQVVAVDQDGNEAVVAEEVPEEGQALAVTDSNGNSFTVDSGGSVSNNGSSNSDASLAAHALEQRLLSELLEDFDQNIALWLENHEKGPLDEQMLRLLQELPPCLPAESEELVTIHQYIERLQADIEEAWNALSEESQQWFSTVVEAFSAEDSSLTEQLSEEEAQRAEEIVCELLTDPDEVTIVLRDDGEVIEADSYVLVSATPEMPALSVEATSASSAQAEVKFRLKIEYRRDIRQDEDYFPAEDWHETGLNEEWQIDFGERIRGGKATLYTQVGERRDTITFHIRGTNPTEQAVKDYIVAEGYDDVWFFTRLIRQESTYRQFNNGTNYGPAWTDTDSQGCPNWGPPHGWGLTQLDLIGGTRANPIRPSAQELWDWKANVDGGYEFLNGEKWSMVNGNMNSNINRMQDWNDDHPDNPVEGHADQVEGNNATNITYTHANSSHFDHDLGEDPTGTSRSFIEAAWMKNYNGSSGGTNGYPGYYYVCKQSGQTKPYWDLHRTNNSGENYVEFVSRRAE